MQLKSFSPFYCFLIIYSTIVSTKYSTGFIFSVYLYEQKFPPLLLQLIFSSHKKISYKTLLTPPSTYYWCRSQVRNKEERKRSRQLHLALTIYFQIVCELQNVICFLFITNCYHIYFRLSTICSEQHILLPLGTKVVVYGLHEHARVIHKSICLLLFFFPTYGRSDIKLLFVFDTEVPCTCPSDVDVFWKSVSKTCNITCTSNSFYKIQKTSHILFLNTSFFCACASHVPKYSCIYTHAYYIKSNFIVDK